MCLTELTASCSCVSLSAMFSVFWQYYRENAREIKTNIAVFGRYFGSFIIRIAVTT